MCRSAVHDGSCSPWVMCSCSVVSGVVNCFLLKCRKLRREDQETSDWIVSRISLFYDMCCYL